ncbi:hypothetical protein CXG81DRAFT_18962 [Caulochytrium protostelioides]|uniref:Cytochrome b561 domain-containing protein n=1 Tax=Caulochytrium protostelioides TaxID=1555241 RepID=A0A4P9X7G3_9FUNG|nr:hypothetical protein CXG81DRAFT_18962 [Caulochytrium protostelioides]|eukprot:RKP01187.1 hypothetical protein CXG81DRAFT_18962 [Caulochytrium protostelioides]
MACGSKSRKSCDGELYHPSLPLNVPAAAPAAASTAASADVATPLTYYTYQGIVFHSPPPYSDIAMADELTAVMPPSSSPPSPPSHPTNDLQDLDRTDAASLHSDDRSSNHEDGSAYGETFSIHLPSSVQPTATPFSGLAASETASAVGSATHPLPAPDISAEHAVCGEPVPGTDPAAAARGHLSTVSSYSGYSDLLDGHEGYGDDHGHPRDRRAATAARFFGPGCCGGCGFWLVTALTLLALAIGTWIPGYAVMIDLGAAANPPGGRGTSDVGDSRWWGGFTLKQLGMGAHIAGMSLFVACSIIATALVQRVRPRQVPRAQRLHGYLQMLGVLGLAVGFTALYLSRSRRGKGHFTGYHGKAGLGTAAVTLLAALSGIIWLYILPGLKRLSVSTQRTLRRVIVVYHRLLAMLAIAGALLSVLTLLWGKWGTKRLVLPVPRHTALPHIQWQTGRAQVLGHGVEIAIDTDLDRDLRAPSTVAGLVTAIYVIIVLLLAWRSRALRRALPGRAGAADRGRGVGGDTDGALPPLTDGAETASLLMAAPREKA